ncbi:MAG TPA: RHS repeat-associated core domain-containing protein, partial [Phycisphaerae bacterium]|nr:RHS repeat-associated core domain-containing protein [Phycisphaerae bacterium]
YCGYFYEDLAGLYHVRHRVYHPSLGRWMQRDPIGYKGEATLYAYTTGSPTAYVDPFGTEGKTGIKTYGRDYDEETYMYGPEEPTGQTGVGATDWGAFRAPEMIARTYRSAVAKAGDDVAMQECLPTEMDVRGALMNIDPVWDVLFPRERERIVKLLVEKVVMNPDSMDVVIRTNGLSSLVAELRETVEEAEGRKVSV